MNYTTLIAPKGTAGSIANWVSYSKVVDVLPTILEEAQTLIYQIMRTREMETTLRFTLTPGMASFALPSRYLDPIGTVVSPSRNIEFTHKDNSFLFGQRFFSEEDGTLGTNPFTTVLDSRLVTVALTANGFRQDSNIYFSGATAVGGLTLNGSYEIYSVATNSFVIDAGEAATSAATGGGSAVDYTVQNLNEGTPWCWAPLDGRIRFDAAFADQTSCLLRHYQRLPLLSSTNLTNFLTDRYPHVVRAACVAAAADFMEDDAKYQQQMSRLTALIQDAQGKDDLSYRGAEIMTETP